MDIKQFREMKEASEIINNSLKRENLSPEERQKLEKSRAEICGYLSSIWLPAGFVKKTVMFLLLIIGIYGVIAGKPIIAICWVLILFLSPRFLAETLRIVGTITS